MVATAGLGLIAQIWSVPYETTVELVRSVDSAAAEAVFISCTNLPTYDVIAGLEATIGKPVLTANQVTMWSALALTNRPATGPGQLSSPDGGSGTRLRVQIRHPAEVHMHPNRAPAAIRASRVLSAIPSASGTSSPRP